MAQSAAILKSSLAVGSSGVSDIVEDTTPQLGGNLDVNGNSIVSTSNGDISISPNGTGNVIIDGLSHPQADGTAGQVLQTDGEGNLSFADQSGGGASSAVTVTESPATDPIQIDLDNGTVFTLDKNTYTNSSITISNGSEGVTYQLVVTSDGNSYTFGNANLYWPNNSAPTPSAVDKKDIYSIIKIGSTYYGSYAFNYN
jgi:hypothetical protein